MHALLLTAALLAPGAEQPARRWSPTDATALASQFCDKLPPAKQRYARFISLHDLPAAELIVSTQVTQAVWNSLSKAPVILPVVVVPGGDGRLLYFDTTLTKIDLTALDNLGLLGSGAAPFPEPFFHQQVKQLRHPKAGPDLGKIVTIHGPWLSPFIEKLAVQTDSASPIFEARWFWTHALDEPRYHEILGLGETIDSFKHVFHVDEKTADALGAQTRGVVIDSEVALQPRVLERTPTQVRFGRGTFHQSLDFNTATNGQDPLKNLLIDAPDASESIVTLFNGLQAYYVSDAAGKRLDLANASLAQDSRTRLKDHQVRTGFHCMGCHEPEKGIIAVSDEVHFTATPDIELLSKRYAGGDRERGQKILEKYFTIDVNELIGADQRSFDASLQAATTVADYPRAKALSCAAYSAALQTGIWEYSDKRVDLAGLAVETGADEEVLKAVIEGTAGLDHTLVGVLRRPQRRDQIEAGLGQLLIALSLLPLVK